MAASSGTNAREGHALTGSSSQWSLMPKDGSVSLLEIALLAVGIILLLAPISRTYQDVIIITLLWGGVAIAWNIAGGYVGLISFGHAAFFGIGAYASTILLVRYGVSPWLGLWVGGVLAAIVGMALALIGARLRGPFFILSTLAAAEVVRIGALNWTPLTGGAEGLWITPTPSAIDMVYSSRTAYAALVLGYAIVVYVIGRVIESSRHGLYLFAVRDDEDAASAAGINPLRSRTWAMGLSAFLTAVGGSLFAQYFQFLDPTYVISPELSFQFALLAALGGLGTAIGALLGAIVIMPLSELLRSYLGATFQGLHLAIYGGFLVIVMLYFPTGIAGALQRFARRSNGRS